MTVGIATLKAAVSVVLTDEAVPPPETVALFTRVPEAEGAIVAIRVIGG